MLLKDDTLTRTKDESIPELLLNDSHRRKNRYSVTQ